MIENAGPGKFILVEGIDGAGKTTALKKILLHFSASHNAIYCKGVFGGGFFGKLSKQALHPWVFAAELLHTTYDILLPACARGQLVLMDKYYFFLASHVPEAGEKQFRLAYQRLAPFLVRPDLSIYFRCSIKERLRRLKNMPVSPAHRRIIENPSWVEERERAYFQKFAEEDVSPKILDTTYLNVNETAEALQKIIGEKVLYGN